MKRTLTRVTAIVLTVAMLLCLTACDLSFLYQDNGRYPDEVITMEGEGGYDDLDTGSDDFDIDTGDDDDTNTGETVNLRPTGVINGGVSGNNGGTTTTVNADINAELLKNLFYNKAPLHDGAVVIAEGRIAAAGCILPLSGKQNISKDLGTRHRAGLGQSENYDSLSVIVSEETGGISLAEGGILKQHLAPETLERLLIAKLMPEEEEQKPTLVDRVRRWIAK